MKKLSLIAAAVGALAMSSGSSQAGYEIFDDTVSTCTTLNCSSIFTPGSVLGVGNSAARWQIAVFGNAGECIRVDEVSASAGDDEMVVVGPNGTVWRNDDFGGTLRPRVAFVAPNNGWYYVTIGNFAGAVVEHNLNVAYGRYSGGAANPNCASATAPALSQQSLKASSASAPQPEEAGSPGR